MVESPQMTRLEASADVPLAPRAVWAAILDGSRWPDWMASGDARGSWSGAAPRLTLDHVTPFFRPSGGRDGATCAVGDIRQESAVVSRPFGLGARRVEWHSIVTDIDDGHSIEIASPEVGGLREWRLRVNILPTGVQPLPSWFRLAPPIDRGAGVRHNEREQVESTRVRAILTYRPVGIFSRLLDRVSLRSMVQARLEAWIAGLARSLSILSDLESRAVSDPIRYLPDVGRSGTAYRAPSRTTGQYPVVRGGVAHADDLAATASYRTVRAAEADPLDEAFDLDSVASLFTDEADPFGDDDDVVYAATDDVVAEAPPVPARAVPDTLPAPAVMTPVAVESPAAAAVALESARPHEVAEAAEPAPSGVAPSGEPQRAEVSVPVASTPELEVPSPTPAEATATPVPALAAVSLLDISLQALEESASTLLTVPEREPEPIVAARAMNEAAHPPAHGDPVAPPPVPSTGGAVSAPRPMLFGEARPSTISASAIAASRRLAAMAANRPVTGLGGAVARPAESVVVGGDAEASKTSLTPSTRVDAPSSVATPVPTIGAVANAARATAAARVEVPKPSAPGLPAAARAAFVGSVLPSSPAVSTAPEPPPAKPAREDSPAASSDAAA